MMMPPRLLPLVAALPFSGLGTRPRHQAAPLHFVHAADLIQRRLDQLEGAYLKERKKRERQVGGSFTPPFLFASTSPWRAEPCGTFFLSPSLSAVCRVFLCSFTFLVALDGASLVMSYYRGPLTPACSYQGRPCELAGTGGRAAKLPARISAGRGKRRPRFQMSL